jgi:hypothetical protein
MWKELARGTNTAGKDSDNPKIEPLLDSASKKAAQFIYGAASPALEFAFRLETSLVTCLGRCASVVSSTPHIGACRTRNRLLPRRTPKPIGARSRPSTAQAQSGR